MKKQLFVLSLALMLSACAPSSIKLMPNQQDSYPVISNKTPSQLSTCLNTNLSVLYPSTQLKPITSLSYIIKIPGPNQALASIIIDPQNDSNSRLSLKLDPTANKNIITTINKCL